MQSPPKITTETEAWANTFNVKHTGHVTSSDTFNAFKIDPNTGEISTTVQINYEEATFYTLTVVATDSIYGVGALSSSAIVTVMVRDINLA